MLRPDQLKIDPARFQYKQSDTKGVTGALLGTDCWEPALANPITVWQDRNGDNYVVNGHQRTDLARRAQEAGQPDVQIPVRIYREADGYGPQEMRHLGAYQNIAEGTGSAMDAARILRARASLPSGAEMPQLPPRSQLVRDARGLAALSPEAFGAVENGVVDPAYAAKVGELVHDLAEQAAAIDMLARHPPQNPNQARLMVQDIRNAGFLRGAQTTLFGDEAFAKSLVPERAKVLDNAMRVLRGTKRTFQAAIEGEEALKGAGNVMASERNVAAKTDNERLLDAIQRDATRQISPTSRLIAVHSHPRGYSLSELDIAQLAHAGLHMVVAVGHDGSLYAVRRGEHYAELRPGDEASPHKVASSGALAIAVAAQRAGLITDEEAQTLATAAANAALHRHGYIDYFSSYKAPRGLDWLHARAVEAASEGLNDVGVHRSPNPALDMGRLQDLMGEPQQKPLSERPAGHFSEAAPDSAREGEGSDRGEEAAAGERDAGRAGSASRGKPSAAGFAERGADEKDRLREVAAATQRELGLPRARAPSLGMDAAGAGLPGRGSAASAR